MSMSGIQAQIAKGLGQIRQVFLGLVARGGQHSIQVQGFADEVLDEIEVIQQVGFASHIPKGAKVVLLPLQGKTAKSIVIATTGGIVEVNLSTGDACMYDQHGHRIVLQADGAHIYADLTVHGSVTASGQISDGTGSMQAIRDTYNSHNHGNAGPNNRM